VVYNKQPQNRRKNLNPIIKNTLAVIIGFLVGSAVNMGIIMVSGAIIPPPVGADVTTMEGLKASIHLFEPKHFLFPFLAHALGTFIGALFSSFLAASHKMKFAIGIGILFLLGGIANILMLPSPLWFTAIDLVGAYIPMGYFAGKMAINR
jgi:hypothetical protein